MAVTLQNAESALKSVYLGVVANQLNVKANPLLSSIKQSSSNVWGKEIIKLAPFGINGGIGAGSEDGLLPMAGSNKYVQFKSSLKNLFGKIEISDKAIRASENNAGAFVNLLNDEMEGLIKASSFNLGRMLYGDGSGLLTTTSSAITTSGTTTFLTVNDTRNLIEGMIIDVYSSGTKNLDYSGRRITFIDRENKKVYLDLPTDNNKALAQNAELYVQGSKGYEITGLEAIFGTGNLYGLNRTEHQWLKPYISNPVSAVEISDILLQKTIDALEDKAGSEINFIACSRDVRRAYQEYLTYYKRNVDVTELAGGQKAITFNGIPLVADRFIADGTLYMLNTNDFTLHQLCDWNWLENEDGKILRQNGTYPTYSATLVKYADLICDRPIAQAKLTNISSSVTNPFASVTE